MGRQKLIVAACAAGLTACVSASSLGTIINFDTDGSGSPIVAPTLFASTVPLREAYAAIGVHFTGPTDLNGGAILSGGGFGVNPRSAPNFLAFSRSATAFMQNGGQPRDPETITFDTPILNASIYASGGLQAATFRMDAFDSGGNLLISATGTNTSGQYVQLNIPAAPGPISRLVLTEVGGDTAWVYDDMEFTFVPEPVGAALLAPTFALFARRRRL